MPTISACPDVHEWQRLLSGELSAPESEPLLAHLEGCDRCAQAVQTLQSADTLTDLMKQGYNLDTNPDDAAVSELVRRLSEQPPAAESPTQTQDPYPFLTPPQAVGEIGRLGPYRVVKVLGQGGMGIVFRAEDPQLKRPVALKVMNPALAASEPARRRFLREAQATAAVTHDHVVTIHHVGEDRGVPFLAMQLLEGKTLETRLRREGPLPVAEVLRIGREAAEGLAAAHDRGLIHRDIKPANVWLEAPTGRVKLLDFGLARAVSDDAHLTDTGAVIGTPAYMAPEQARGKPVDFRCDLFSLGCVLYRMATGHAPFQGPDKMATLFAVAHEEPVPVQEANPAVPPGLAALITKLLAKNPDERPPSARAVAETLEQMQSSGVASAPREQGVTKHSVHGALTRPRSPVWWKIAAAVLLLGGGGVLLQQIVVRIKDKDGKVVSEITVPQGKTAEIVQNGKVIAMVPPVGEQPKPAAVVVKPAPLPPSKPGEPLSPLALVTRPAALPGVQSWTLETRQPRGAYGRVAYSPDGRSLAASGQDGTVRIWDVESGTLRRALTGAGLWGGDVAWSPDGRRLAASGGNEVKLWEAASGRMIRTLRGHGGDVAVLAWAPDGKTLASGGAVGEIRLWDVATGQTLEKLQGHPSWVWALAWSPDGKTLASSGVTDTIWLWEAESGRMLRQLKGVPPQNTNSLAFAPDGKRLAAACDGFVRLWDPTSGQLVRKLGEPLYGTTRSVSWSPDGKEVREGTAMARVRVWDAVSGQERRIIQMITAGTEAVAWSPDGKQFVQADQAGFLHFGDLADGRLVRTIQGHLLLFGVAPAWSPDGKSLALGYKHNKGHIHLWQLPPEAGPRLLQGEGLVKALTWAPDGGTLAYGGYSGWVRQLRIATGEVRTYAKAHRSPTAAVAYSPDGKTLATGGEDKDVHLWQPETWQRLRTLTGLKSPVRELAWSPDGKLLAGRGDDSTLRVWDVNTGTARPDPAGHKWNVRALAWSPDSKTLAYVAGDLQIHLWDAVAGRQREPALPNAGFALSLAWSPDGKTLITTAEDRSVCRWDVAERCLLRNIAFPVPGVLSPDARTLACAGANAVQLWQTDPAQPLGTLVGLRNDQYLFVSPEGHYRGSPRVERELIYVVQTADGVQHTLTVEEFGKRFGWKNDPERVKL